MAHFAEIDSNNIVLRVVTIDDSEQENGNEYLSSQLNLGGTWIQTSYNTYGGVHLKGGVPLRKNYAGVGFTYDSQRDAFIAPQPFPSWMLDENTCLWQAPVPYPTDNKMYSWIEESKSWKES